MSISLMTLVWKSNFTSVRKMVLLALCDNANDQGECFPSVTMLAEKCSLSQRTVQDHISELEKAGVLKREMRLGRSTIYYIDPRRICTPAADAPVREMHPTPADDNMLPQQMVHPTPAAAAPITIIESSIESSINHNIKTVDKFSASKYLETLGVDKQISDDWIKHRAKKKTEASKTVIDGHVREALKAGLLLQDALAMVCERGWVGFKSEWAINQQPARASPQYQTPNEKAKSWADALTGKNNERTRNIIDINTIESSFRKVD